MYARRKLLFDLQRFVAVSTFEEFKAAVESGGDIKLASDITVNESITIDENVTLDLAGKTLTTKDQIIVDDGITFTLNDSKDGDKAGQIFNDVEATLVDFGSNCKAAIQVGKSSGENAKFIMNGGIILAGDNGINIAGKAVAVVNDGMINSIGNSAVFALTTCEGNDDHFNFVMNGGTLTTSSYSRATIQSQGNSTAYIKLNGGKVIRTETDFELPPAAIYASNIGKIVVSGTAEIITVTSGIELRTGDLEVTGGKITNTLEKYTLYPFGSGETTTGSAISVSQHNSKKNINVTISGGEISGPVALSTANPQKNEDFGKVISSGGEIVDGKRVVGTVSINIIGGTFTSTSTDTDRSISSEEVHFTYNNKDYDVIKYTFAGKNAIFNADGRIDISISGATIEGDLATITDTVRLVD